MATHISSQESIQERAKNAFLGLADGGRDLGNLLERLSRKLREDGYRGPSLLSLSMILQLDDTWAEHALRHIAALSNVPRAPIPS